jgi:hypothetical protein
MFENEASHLRNLARKKNVEFYYVNHALVEMKNDDIAKIDIENMLRRCRVTLVEDKKGEETWRAEGNDYNGRPIVATIVAYEDAIVVKIVTAWKKD